MKKITLLVIILSSFLLVGCELNQGDLECTGNQEIIDDECVNKEPLEQPLDISDGTEGFEVSVSNSLEGGLLSDKYFGVVFTSVTYEPVTGDVCIQYDINDEDYANATYYVVLQEDNSLLTHQQSSFTLSSKTASNRNCFDNIQSSNLHHILIGKVDKDDLNPTDYIEAVGRVSFRDVHYEDRARIDQIDLTHEDIPEDTEGDLPYARFKLKVNDNRSVTDVKIKLYEKEFDNLIETQEYEITSSLRLSTKFFLNNIWFEDLAPGVKYYIVITASGNDGFTDYEDVFIAKDDFTSGCFNWMCGVSFVDLYAGILDVYETDNDAIIDYKAHNTGDIVSSSDNLPYELELVIKDSTQQEKYRTSLNVNETSISIPETELEFGDFVTIESNKDDLTFATYEYIEEAPMITIVSTRDGIAIFDIIGDLEVVNHISMEFAREENLESVFGSFGIENPTEVRNTKEIMLYSTMQMPTSYYVFINMSYETSVGTRLHQEWIKIN